MRRFPRLSADQRWYYAFLAMLLFRLLLPVYSGPMDHLYSDMLRHWDNALNFFHPGLWGGIDSKLYQLYLYVIALAGQYREGPVNLYTGLLCAGTGYVWYRAARELYGRRGGLKLGLLLGTCPSLWLIYCYFMNETVLLFLLGSSLWLTFRALRKQEKRAARLAAAAWVLLAFTRIIAVPLSVAGLWFLLVYLKDRRFCLRFMLPMLALCTLLAGWHSMAGMKVFAPFGFTGGNTYYHYSGLQRYDLKMRDGFEYYLQCPSFYYNLWAPFGHYTSCRPNRSSTIFINPYQGRMSWNTAIHEQKMLFTWDKFWCQFPENQLFLWFGNSWPDSDNLSAGWLQKINFHSRWMWAPLMLMMVWAFFFRRFSRPEWLIICSGCGLLLLLTLQQTGVMEGRFRKPMEPLVLWTIFAMFRRGDAHLMPSAIRAYPFIREVYLLPVAASFKRLAGCMRRSA